MALPAPAEPLGHTGATRWGHREPGLRISPRPYPTCLRSKSIAVSRSECCSPVLIGLADGPGRNPFESETTGGSSSPGRPGGRPTRVGSLSPRGLAARRRAACAEGPKRTGRPVSVRRAGLANRERTMRVRRLVLCTAQGWLPAGRRLPVCTTCAPRTGRSSSLCTSVPASAPSTGSPACWANRGSAASPCRTRRGADTPCRLCL